MKTIFRRPRALAVLVLLALSVEAPVSPALAQTAPTPKTKASTAPRSTPMTGREKTLHALNRLGFGPRPGDVERVERMGVSAWIEEQLAPDSISDARLSPRLAPFSTLTMSSETLYDTFERPIREARRQKKAAAGAAGQTTAMSASETAKADADAFEEIRNRIPPEKRPRRVIEELSAARVLRAAYSERQLNEVLVDFWMNHFNVYAAKGLDRVLITSFERDVVRPRIWGRFEDLLLATAKSPAMLFYLDNARSVADPEHRPALPARRLGRFASAFARPATPGGADSIPAKRKGGLNENYAREIMELHTLGVDGGYSQRDVTELARVLTGWSIDPQRGEFRFRERVHDAGTKTVLGRTIPAGGIEEGEQAILILARQPATARHIARELCERFVSDAPSQALVDRVAARFTSSRGDLRETVRAIVESPDFFAPETYRAKVKSPFEYVVSAIRASGGETEVRPPLLREIARMGEPLYLCQPPTGYSDAATAWVNTGALVARMNFAIALAANGVPGTRVDLARLVDAKDAADPKRSIDALARLLIGGDLSEETRATILRRLGDGAGAERRPADGAAPGEDTLVPVDRTPLSLIAGLILGSPEFQRQ